MPPPTGFRFLSLVKPFMSILPEVVQPDRRIPFRCALLQNILSALFIRTFCFGAAAVFPLSPRWPTLRAASPGARQRKERGGAHPKEGVLAASIAERQPAQERKASAYVHAPTVG